jgi:membrane-bound lytic murein transglycosylase D
MKMTRICEWIVFLALAAIMTVTFTGCSRGAEQPPKTEPAADDTTREQFKPAAKNEKSETEEKGKTGTASGSQQDTTVQQQETTEGEKGDKPLERPQVQVTELQVNESVPVILPQKKPGQVELETAEVKKTKALADSISSGVTGIIRGFGYTGTIDVPENFRRRVAYYIRYFTENVKGSRFYRRAMVRGSQYLPMIEKVFKKKHLPLSLAYLPVIESGFKETARSRARAVGMWQFMKGTARMYGLRVNRRIDQRKDPIKSTIAAAEYLNDLLAMFGAEDPFLGISAYNAGEGKIMKALRKISYKERSFWTLVRKNLLRNETDEYIPRLLAVVLIASDAEKYAAASKNVPLEMEPEEVEKEDTEIISSFHSSKDNLGEPEPQPEPEAGISTDAPAQEETAASSQQPEAVKDTVTKTKPAVVDRAPIQERKTVPAGTGDSVYMVKKGDTLYSIARSFKVSVNRLKRWNRLRSNRIYPGQKLSIHSPGAVSTREKPSKGVSSRGYRLVYTVNYTDSLARIALFFKGVSARDIMRWNRLRRSRIYPKQKLALYLKQPPRKVLTHVVKRGETARKIAGKYRLRVEYVLSLNGLVTNSRLRPGKRLKIYYF